MNFKNINSNGTVTIGATGRGIKLHSVVINTKGAAANTLTLTDTGKNAVIAVIDTVNINSQALVYDIDTIGPITAALATGTAADVTITYQ